MGQVVRASSAAVLMAGQFSAVRPGSRTHRELGGIDWKGRMSHVTTGGNSQPNASHLGCERLGTVA